MATIFAANKPAAFYYLSATSSTSVAAKGHDAAMTPVVHLVSGQRAGVLFSLGGAQSEVMVRAKYGANGNGLGVTFGSCVGLQLLAASGTPLFRLRHVQNIGVRAEYWNGSTWVAATGAFALDMDNVTTVWLGLAAKIDDTTGYVRVWVGDVLVSEFTGDTLLTSDTAVAYAQLIGLRDQNSNENSWSEVAAANGGDDLTGHRVKSLAISGAGSTNTWAAGDYSAIDETGAPDLTDALVSDTAAQDFVAALTSPSLAAGASVRAVAVNAYAGRGATGPQNLRALANVGGTLYDTGADQAVPGGVGPWTQVFETNPATGAPWAAAAVNSVQLGVRSKA